MSNKPLVLFVCFCRLIKGKLHARQVGYLLTTWDGHGMATESKRTKVSKGGAPYVMKEWNETVQLRRDEGVGGGIYCVQNCLMPLSPNIITINSKAIYYNDIIYWILMQFNLFTSLAFLYKITIVKSPLSLLRSPRYRRPLDWSFISHF